jgi:hypothetical protein
MAYSFNKINSGVKSFGVHKGALYASEYIMSKKTLTTFCNTNKCENSFFPVKNGKVNTQGNLLMLNKANNLKYYAKNNVKNGNLYINLITKLNLQDVPVICNNTSPNLYSSPVSLSKTSTVPYYINYQVDPSGNLFGNTTCGKNRFLSYLVYNPPYTTTDPEFINNL